MACVEHISFGSRIIMGYVPDRNPVAFLFPFISGADLDRLSESSDRWIHKDSCSHSPMLPITQSLIALQAKLTMTLMKPAPKTEWKPLREVAATSSCNRRLAAFTCF